MSRSRVCVSFCRDIMLKTALSFKGGPQGSSQFKSLRELERDLESLERTQQALIALKEGAYKVYGLSDVPVR